MQRRKERHCTIIEKKRVVETQAKRQRLSLSTGELDAEGDVDGDSLAARTRRGYGRPSPSR